MKLIKAIIRPTKLQEVQDTLAVLNVNGLTVTEVRGHGRQKGHRAIYRGGEYNVTLLPRVMVEIVLPEDQVQAAIKAIVAAARTGEVGDGLIFVLPVEECYNIRTGERDAVAAYA